MTMDGARTLVGSYLGRATTLVIGGRLSFQIQTCSVLDAFLFAQPGYIYSYLFFYFSNTAWSVPEVLYRSYTER